MAAKKVGRPLKYKPEYCEEIKEYFKSYPLYKEETEERMSASGAIKDVVVKVPNDFPMLEDFALRIDVCPETISDWQNKFPEFSKACKVAKGVQKQFITKHALSKNYSEGFSKFFAINNLGMVEKSELKTENEHKHEGYGLAFDLTRKPE